MNQKCGWIEFFWDAALRCLRWAVGRVRSRRVSSNNIEHLRRLIEEFREQNPPPWQLPLAGTHRRTRLEDQAVADAKRRRAILNANVVNRGQSDEEISQARRREDKHEMTRKEAYFDSILIDGWPRPEEIESYFIFAPDQPWPFADNDSAGFDIDGIDDTHHLPIRDHGRSNVSLHLSAHPILGVYLGWRKWDGRRRAPQSYASKGDLSRLGQFV